MTLDELLNSVDIADLFVQLGGKLQGQGKWIKGNAFWRGSGDMNLSISRSRKIWTDLSHHDEELNGRGVLGLIMTSQGCDKKRALVLLQELTGLSLDDSSQVEPPKPINPHTMEDAKHWATGYGWYLEEQGRQLKEHLEADILRTGEVSPLREMGLRLNWSLLKDLASLGDRSLIAKYEEHLGFDKELTLLCVARSRQWTRLICMIVGAAWRKEFGPTMARKAAA